MTLGTSIASLVAAWPKELPQFWELRSAADQRAHEELRPKPAALVGKSLQTKNSEAFCQIVKHLRQFVVRGGPDVARRGLFCGIVWLKDSIAINTHQFRLISSKCILSINAALQALGCGTIPSGGDVFTSLIARFPFMERQFPLLRPWTIS
jgi:hypothetical protein